MLPIFEHFCIPRRLTALTAFVLQVTSSSEAKSSWQNHPDSDRQSLSCLLFLLVIHQRTVSQLSQPNLPVKEKLTRQIDNGCNRTSQPATPPPSQTAPQLGQREPRCHSGLLHRLHCRCRSDRPLCVSKMDGTKGEDGVLRGGGNQIG
jgi:hypothetical protein